MEGPTNEFPSNTTTSNQNDNSIINQILSGNLTNDVQQLKIIFDKTFDVVYREIEIGGSKKGVLIFIDGLVNIELIDSDILKPLLNYGKTAIQPENIQVGQIQSFLQNQVITTSNIKLGINIQDVVECILSGDTVLLIDGEQQAISMNLRKFDKRNVEEPTVEPLIRGPRDGFTEDLRTNISLIRRRLKTYKLKMENMKVGRLSKTDIVITYLDGIVKDSLVEEVRQRISRIDIDAILESGYIEELIEDNSFSIFSQFGVTERPDRLAAGLLEGHVGILVDNTPMALITPETFVEMMEATEDYYGNYISASFIRFIRYLFLGIALLLPSFYIALLTFHQVMVARPLLLSIASSREGVPFPLFVESLLMEIFFEGLQEASTRLPRVAGQTVSIVGGLVIGQAAVQAGIVSAATVIVVSITGIAIFIIPRFNLTPTIRMLRFFMIILSGALGLYGIFIGLLIILIHMVKLRSFGIPFLSPVTPLSLSIIKDTLVRAPWWAMISRPEFMETKDSQRMKKTLRPRTPKRNK
ncbi:spore germination protein [Clostridium sp. DJ247]|uniref:spore germination protein n=1 Tax=Clostridium sp. DJ247 TaxID=2726188 RepID=UPI0016252538|nr:spore germination protein [Clostridium sp. DJ247]MBC2581225.1 spore germination protein [Clostridium sp. DJ247]